MSALLKIIQGPNAGAEIALPDGVEITVGKADSCDIVLADPTLPDAPLKLSADASGTVSAVIPPESDFTPLSPAHVFFYGTSALAVGPADSAWPALVFPSPEPAGKPDANPASDAAPAPSSAEKDAAPAAPARKKKEKRAKKRRGCGCFLWLLLILALLAVAAWFFRERLSPVRERVQPYYEGHVRPFYHNRVVSFYHNRVKPKFVKKTTPPEPEPVLADFADRYGLALDGSKSRPTVSGNFATRAERLAATAELYSTFPGVALDLTDDESLRTAVADSLFTLGQANITVASVSNRVATLAGNADSPAALAAALDAIRADVPRLAKVHTSKVTVRGPAAETPAPAAAVPAAPAATRRRSSRAAPATPVLPVCGILATPYPCLVLQNGSRVFPGGTIGGSVVVSIDPDSVVLTNANGSFTWKP